MTYEQQQAIVAQCAFNDWELVLHREHHGNPRYLQIEWNDEDNYNPGQPYRSKGRKWLISPYMTRSELVLTAWKAVLTAVEHEIREQFTYNGRTIMHPHVDVDVLWRSAAQSSDVRPDPAAA